MNQAAQAMPRESGADPEGLDARLAPEQLAARRVWLSHLRGTPDPDEPGLTNSQWSSLVEEADRHHLTPLTYRLLEDGPFADRPPAALRARLRSSYELAAFRNAVLLRRTEEYAAALHRVGIPVILLKGIHLCRYVYPEPALRPMADVDLLVPRDRLAQVEQLFLDAGFGPVPRPDVEQFCTWSNHLAKLYKEGAPVLEVHWTIERPTAPFLIDLEGLWARARPVKLGGARVHVLATEDLLLHLSLHASYHHRFDWSALRGLVDIDRVVAHCPVDWKALAERANAWGAAAFVYTTLRLTRELLGTPVPPSCFDSLRHEPDDEAVVELARQHVLSLELELPTAYLELADKPGLRERWRLIRHRVFLPRETLERLYGQGDEGVLVYSSYLRRVIDLLGRRGRLLLQALLRTKTVHFALVREANRRRIEGWVNDRAHRRSPPASGR